MKKLTAFLLASNILLSMTSCNFAKNYDDIQSKNSDNTQETVLTSDNPQPQTPSTGTPLFYSNDLAMQMYEAALNNEIMVYETVEEKFQYLKDYRTPYDRIPLEELGSLSYIYMDVDGDSVNELVIDCGDTLILRYHECKVYVYPFTFRNLYDLTEDGSYYWNHTGTDFEYGEKKLAFEGAKLASKSVWRIVNDGEPNAEYYIGDKQVSEEEILKYLEGNPKTRVEFSPLEVSWMNEISYYEAFSLAEKYWERYEIDKNHYLVEHGWNSNAPSSVYVMVIRRSVIDHYSTFDEIWIDKNTGKAIVPYDPGK